MALGVALAARHRRPSDRSARHLRKAHRQLPFQPAWLLRLLLSLAWPPPVCAASASLPSDFGAAFSRASIARRIPRDVLDKMAIHRPRNQRLMPDGSQDGSRQTRKSAPRKRRLRSEAGRHRSSSHSRQSLRVIPFQDATIRLRVVGTSNTALAMRGARQRRAVLLRTPYLAAEVRAEEPTTRTSSRTRDEELVTLAHRAELALHASGTTLVETRTSNPIASRAADTAPLLRGHHADRLLTAHDTHEGGPVPPQGLHSGRKAARLSYFARGSSRMSDLDLASGLRDSVQWSYRTLTRRLHQGIRAK